MRHGVNTVRSRKFNLKKSEKPILYKYTAPTPHAKITGLSKNFIKIWKNLVAKKSPGCLVRGKDGNNPSRRSNDLRHHRKEVYTLANEEATEKDSYAC